MQDTDIRSVFENTRSIAVVGWSPSAARPSHGVAEWLVTAGFQVYAINPGHAGALGPGGEPVRGSLTELNAEGVQVDMVDVFRRSDAVPEVVEEALQLLPGLKTIWMQLGVINEAAAERARARGLLVVMDRCPRIEIPRLFGPVRGLSFG